MENAPTETKVKAATAGAGAGVAVAEVVDWALGRFVFDGPPDLGNVPGPVQAIVVLVSAAGLSYAAGWWAKHTPRP